MTPTRHLDTEHFAHRLHRRASETPDRAALGFFEGPTLQPVMLTYLQLWQRVAGLASELQDALPPQQRVLIACRSHLHFSVAFLACLVADLVAVPTPMPRRQLLRERLQLLAQDADVAAVLFDTEDLEHLAIGAAGKPPLSRWNVSDQAAPHARRMLPTSWRGRAGDLAALAFLQYTSGSTGDPKGVVVTHANLLRNSALIQEAMAIDAASRVFTALPLFHDMGLVGGLLQPLYAGCVGYSMTPAQFVQYPEHWLQVVSRFGITISGGPDFMYDLAARAIDDSQLADLDLASWRLAFCGAEPIRPHTIEAFVQRFARAGFRSAAFYPCYGMAESTLFITGKPAMQAWRLTQGDNGQVVSCGKSFQDTQVCIVDPQTRQVLPDLAEGEIWVRGASVAQGYWRRPDLSAAQFGALLADGSGSFLRTGDLGFMAAGELHVTGRLKDLLIVRGRKYAPQDLETAAAAGHEAVLGVAGAAFAVTGAGGEAVVLVQELRREWWRRTAVHRDIVRALRQAVHAAHGLQLHDVVLIKPASLPRTSSGKVRRNQTRADYLAQRLACQPAANVAAANHELSLTTE